MNKQIYLKDNLKWYEPQPPQAGLFNEIMSLATGSHCVIYISSKAYAIDGVFNVLDWMRNNQVTFDVVIKEPVGSLATIFVCGAKTVYMTKSASIAALDPTVHQHGFPTFSSLGRYWRNNPAEKGALTTLVKKVCNTEDAEIVLSKIEKVYSHTTSQSLQYLNGIQDKLVALMNFQHMNNKKEIAHYLTIGAGSWDQRIFADDLKQLGFQISECTEDEKNE